MWTRYKWDEKNGQHDLFNIEKCDHCGCDIQAPNSVGSPELASRLRSLGMREYKAELPDEGSLILPSEDVVCNDCYGKYLRKEIGVE